MVDAVCCGLLGRSLNIRAELDGGLSAGEGERLNGVCFDFALFVHVRLPASSRGPRSPLPAPFLCLPLGAVAYSSPSPHHPLLAGLPSLPIMATSIYFPQQRGNGYAEKPRTANGLPMHSSAVREKWQRHHQSSSWLMPISLPIPGVRTRRLRLMLPNAPKLHHVTITRFGRRRGRMILVAGFAAVVFTVIMMISLRDRFSSEDRNWTTYAEPPTLVYRREDLQRIWEWEVSAGHYPSGQKGAFALCALLIVTGLTQGRSPGEHWAYCAANQSRAAPEKVVDHPLTLPSARCDQHRRYWCQACVYRHSSQAAQCRVSPTAIAWQCGRYGCGNGTL